MGGRVILHGERICGGIGIGRLFFIDRNFSKIPHLERTSGQLLLEIERLRRALDDAEADLKTIIAQNDLDHESASILEAQRMMIADPTVFDMICKMILDRKINAEWAVLNVVDQLISIFKSNGVDYYVKAKIADCEAIRDKIIGKLTGNGTGAVFDELPHEDFIVCAKNLTLDELFTFSKNPFVKGVALEAPGGVSHISIVLRTLNIPAVIGIPDLIKILDYGDSLIVNGFQGELILRPTKSEIAEARRTADNFKNYFSKLLADVDEPSVSSDGRVLSVGGNIEQVGEVDFVKKYGGEFIGLFRTELMFSKQYEIPDENTHYDVYYQVLHRTLPNRATIRIFDFGEDKSGAIVTKGSLGIRGIRLCKQRPDVFMPQIRGLIRAAKLGNLNILLPFVSTVNEVEEFRELLESTAAEMGLSENLESVRIGAMIEVPASIFIAGQLARRVDFFSVGTNDLIQYLMAVERRDEFSSYYFSHYFPAVTRILYDLTNVAKEAGKPISICGEMASDPYFSLVFLAMGISGLSMNPTSIPIVKKVIKNGTAAEGEVLLKKLLAAEDKAEVIQILDNSMSFKNNDIFRREWNLWL